MCHGAREGGCAEIAHYDTPLLKRANTTKNSSSSGLQKSEVGPIYTDTFMEGLSWGMAVSRTPMYEMNSVQ